MAHTVLIDKKEYSSCIIDRLDRMKRNNRHCNFAIKVGFVEIQVHRTVLCAASDYFDAMLSHNTKENLTGVVEMIGVDEECVKICVDHIYGRQVAIPPKKYEQLIHVASLMQLQMLRDGIVDLLEKKMDSSTFFVAKKIADLYYCRNLGEKCVEYAENSFPSISKEKNFVDLDKKYIKKIVKSKSVKMTEENKLDSVLRWVNCDFKRIDLLEELLSAADIRLEEVSLEKRHSLMKTDPVVSVNMDLYRKFATSLMNVASSDVTDAKAGNETAIVIFDKLSGHLQSYDPRNNTLTQMQEMNNEMKKRRFSAVLLSDHLYVLMQNKLVYCLNYSYKSATWEQITDMVEEHGSYPPAVASALSIYVVGGSLIYFSFFSPHSSSFVEQYDSMTNIWVELTSKPESSIGSEVLASRGSIYCFGGVSELPESGKSVQRLSLNSSKWENLPPMNEERSNVGVIEVNSKIYVLGGLCDKQKLRSVEQYDPEKEKWTLLEPMIAPRSRLRCFFIDGCIYAVGGDDSKSTIEKYHVEKDEWEMVSLPSGTNLKIADSVIVGQET